MSICKKIKDIEMSIMKDACKICDMNQIDKVCSIHSLSQETERYLKQEIEAYLKNVDMRKSNPDVMGDIWKIMSYIINDDNPYSQIKIFYNQEVKKIAPEVEQLIQASDNSLDIALKIAISGNLIDFAAKHEFEINTLKEKVREVTLTKLAIDDSKEMFRRLEDVKTLLYLGDNCGEIVLDKIFIQNIKKQNPNIQVYYGVRGMPIVNDVTIEDAQMVNMDEEAIVIANGDGALGTVLKNTDVEFQKVYHQSDIVISKGQGNYESLLGSEKEQLYFLFMAKCEIVSEPLKIPLMSIVCMKNKLNLKW